MPYTLAGYAIIVNKLEEDLDIVGTSRDAWVNAAYVKQMKIFSAIRKWLLTCSEQKVAWSSSVVNSLRTTIKAGSAVTWVVDEGDAYTVTTNVYILAIHMQYDSPSLRVFTIQLQEA